MTRIESDAWPTGGRSSKRTMSRGGRVPTRRADRHRIFVTVCDWILMGGPLAPSALQLIHQRSPSMSRRDFPSAPDRETADLPGRQAT